VFGPGTLARLGDLVAENGGTNVLLVSDPGIVQAGHVRRAECSLAAVGLRCTVFDGVCENPTTDVVEACRDAARAAGVDFLVGLGGGSSLDTAKGCNFLLTNGGRMEDYWGVGKATQPMLPLIAVPTTAGTGSECQSFALISQAQTHVKMACGDRKAAARVALLDPELSLTMPPAVAATTAMDALSHAVESAVTSRRTVFSQMFSREAFRLCVRGQRALAENPADLAARGDVLLGAALGGLAIENSMLGAAHAAANPLTARFGVMHGHAVGVMLPAVVRFNAGQPEVRRLYQELALYGGLTDDRQDAAAAVDAVVHYLEEFRRGAGLPAALCELGIEADAWVALAADAAGQWTAGFNPRPVSAEDFAGLYRAAWRENGAAVKC